VKYRPADDLYPHKPYAVAKLVSQRAGKNPTAYDLYLRARSAASRYERKQLARIMREGWRV
jgi:hypothetical protein